MTERDERHEPPSGVRYHRLLAGTAGPVAMLLAVLLVGAAVLVAAPLLVGLLLDTVFALVSPHSGRGAVLDSLSRTELTPLRLAYLSLSLAAAIPVVLGVVWLVHGRRPGWLASVRPGIRWRWFVACALISLVVLGVTLVASSLLGLGGQVPDAPDKSVAEYSDTARDFLLVIVLLTPLQAAGEEYAFRGYLTQVVGGLYASRAVAVVVPALLFALAHGGQELPIFLDRFAFGLVAGVLVIATGGLEAGIAMHVVNNWVAFSVALGSGQMGTVLTPEGSTWWQVVVTLLRSLLFLALVWWAARRMGVATRTRRPDAGPDFAPGGSRM